MYPLLKYLLFLLPAESAHNLTTRVFTWMAKLRPVASIFRAIYRLEHPALETKAFGLTFPNPVGLAAGFDKDGRYIQAMSMLGFGFIEIGTVTPKPQIGNPKPRLFRLVRDKALLNRMGFNNLGVDHLIGQLKKLPHRAFVLGGNIGKNKTTSNEDAWKDYLVCFQKLYDYVDYFVVNLSSPNTPGLRDLQQKEPLKKILQVLIEDRRSRKLHRPILLKISPDIHPDQIDDILDVASELNLDGIIATNTTIDRSLLNKEQEKVKNLGSGGISGQPLQKKSMQVIEEIHRRSNGQMDIIGVGGIDSGQSAQDKLDAGASLVQLYSGLIYRGPAVIKQIKRYILKRRSK